MLSRETSRSAAATHAGGRGPRVAAVAAIAALGVVFGDIGTSPLYALKTVFLLDGGAVRANQERRVRRHLADVLEHHDHRLDQVRRRS